MSIPSDMSQKQNDKSKLTPGIGSVFIFVWNHCWWRVY